MPKKESMKFIIAGIMVLVTIAYVISIRIYSIYGNSIVSMTIGNHRMYPEIVSSRKSLEKGLGGRNALCSSCGMLFEFQRAGKYAFWMKNMKFPLDIIWIFQGKIVHIEKNIQPDFVGTLAPLEEADEVLEINAGNVDGLGIKIGDTISVMH